MTPIVSRAPAGPASARVSAWSHKWPLLLASAALLLSDGIHLVPRLLLLLVLLGVCIAGGLSVLRQRAARSAQGAPRASRYPAPIRAGTPQEQWASHRAALYARGDAMRARAMAGAEPATLVVFEQVDLPELHAVFGALAAQRLAAGFERKLKVLAGEEGLAVRTGPTCWAVLLPSYGGDGALAAVKETLGTGMAVEADAEDDELLLVPRIALLTLHDATTTMRMVYQELCEQITALHAHEMRRAAYLRRERESHS